uniref:Uncharacterized protein n=1 Tax=Anguilla anguilla TaxID=7936 RepID=A0A0E9RGM0_ANGAN
MSDKKILPLGQIRNTLLHLELIHVSPCPGQFYYLLYINIFHCPTFFLIL